MLVVVDANELFSLLIKGSEDARGILLSDKLELIAPEFILLEFANNESEILSKTHENSEEFSQMLSIIGSRITLFPKQEFVRYIRESSELLPGHAKDAPYLALALKFNCPLWSEEKQLKQQSRVKVLTTKELSGLLS